MWLRNFLFFKKTFIVSLFWTVLEPIMYLGAIGLGLGRFVDQIEGLSFIDFYYPGLLASTAMMVSYFEATYPNYTKMTHQKTYSTILLTPLTVEQVLSGEVLWAATKGFIGVCGVVFVSAFFGLFQFKVLLALPFLFLTCLVFSTFGMLMTVTARNYDSFIFSTSGIIIPMSLISGTYFSIQDLPLFFKGLSALLPLSHSVELIRHLIYSGLQQVDFVHFGVLLVYVFILIYFANKLFKKRLIH